MMEGYVMYNVILVDDEAWSLNVSMKLFPWKEYGFEVRLATTRQTEALDYIEKNLSLKLTASEIAKNLFVSESKLVKLFKSEIGVTIGKYIDDYLFDYAEHLLLNTKLSIRQISEKLEFCDQFYFSLKFTVKYGKSPRTYRKEMDGFRM